MSLNWKEIDLVLEELKLEGAMIQKIRQPDFKSLILDLYKPENHFPLLINLNQGNVRIHRLTRVEPGKVVLQRFVQFLRARVNDTRISSAKQLGEERIIKLIAERGEEKTFIYLRMWGGASNIIVTDSSNSILDVFYRRPKQNEISGQTYCPEEIKPLKKLNSPEKHFKIREYDREKGFNEHIEYYYRNLEVKKDLDTIRARVKNILLTRQSSLESSLSGLMVKQANYENFEQYREHAEIVKANIYRINKKDTLLRAENYFNNNNSIEIGLDPSLSPGENSNRLFLKYKKAKTGIDNILGEIQYLKRNLALLKSEEDELFGDQNSEEELERLKSFLQNVPKQKILKDRAKIPGLQFMSGDFTILAGRTAAENDLLLRKFVRGNDFWLHTRDTAGGYVFIKAMRGKSIPLETLLDAGNLAVFFSKSRKSGQADLYYTQVKHLRRPKEGKKGLVLPTHEKNLEIRTDVTRLNRLLGRDLNE